MQRSKILAATWLPVVIWVCLIFAASTDAMSSSRTSRFIGPVLRWLHPEISDESIRTVQLAIRKGAHLTEYAILSMLLYRAFRRQWTRPPRVWCRSCAAWAFALASLYAASDEFHQSFVASRQGALLDVLIDMCGAALGLMFILFYLRNHARFVSIAGRLRKSA